MRRISAANATPDKKFQDANPGTGQPATSFNAAWPNDVQESLMYIIELSGRGETPNAYDLFRAMTDLQFRVGDYKISENGQSPGVVFTWQSWVEVAGRFLVGLDETQTEFNAVGKLGGAKSVNATIPRDGWGTQQSTSGHLPEPSVSGRLVTGSGKEEDSENLESLGHAANTPQVPVATLPPYRVVKMWKRMA